MKRGTLLSLLLLVLLLTVGPPAGRATDAESWLADQGMMDLLEAGEAPGEGQGAWAAFAERVNDLASRAEGELLIRDVQAPACRIGEEGWPIDVPLHIPEGVRLVLENCVFESMLVASGDITLRNSKAGQGDSTGIYIMEAPDFRGKSSLKLTIDRDSVVATGQDDAILDCHDFREDSSIRIYNYGTIESPQRALRFGGGGAQTLTVANYGVIRGTLDLSVYPENKPVSFYVENSGVMESAYAPLQIWMEGGPKEDGKVIFHNQQGGVLRATGEDDWRSEAVGILQHREPEAAATLACEIINDGLIEGGSRALYVTGEGPDLWPVILRGAGEYSTREADAPRMAIEIEQIADSEEDLAQSPEELRNALDAWLGALGFHDFPEGTKTSVTYLAGTWWSEDGSYESSSEERFTLDLVTGVTAFDDGLPAVPYDGEEEAGLWPPEEAMRSWASFAGWINGLAAEAEGTLTILYAQSPAYNLTAEGEPDDVPLAIPEGVQLVFQECWLDGILLSSGDITLRGSTVGYGESAAICIVETPDARQKARLKLTIDAHSQVAPDQSFAIAGAFSRAQGIDIEIVNHGVITSPWAALRLSCYGAASGEADSSLSVYNDGTIQGCQDLYLDTGGGEMTVYVENSGLMECAYAPLEIVLDGNGRAGKATFWNREDGILRATGSEFAEDINAAMTLQVCKSGTGAPPVTGEIINDGLIEGDACALTLLPYVDRLAPVTLRGGGTYSALRPGAPTLIIRVLQEADSEAEVLPSPEALEAALAGWLAEMGFDALPPGTGASVQYYPTLWVDEGYSFEERFAFDLAAGGTEGAR